jgi:hypothetical protein
MTNDLGRVAAKLLFTGKEAAALRVEVVTPWNAPDDEAKVGVS